MLALAEKTKTVPRAIKRTITTAIQSTSGLSLIVVTTGFCHTWSKRQFLQQLESASLNVFFGLLELIAVEIISRPKPVSSQLSTVAGIRNIWIFSFQEFRGNFIRPCCADSYSDWGVILKMHPCLRTCACVTNRCRQGQARRRENGGRGRESRQV